MITNSLHFFLKNYCIPMDDEKINISVRKFLKNVGITSQRKIEEKIRDKFKSGEIKDINKIKVKATITSDILELNEYSSPLHCCHQSPGHFSSSLHQKSLHLMISIKTECR